MGPRERIVTAAAGRTYFAAAIADAVRDGDVPPIDVSDAALGLLAHMEGLLLVAKTANYRRRSDGSPRTRGCCSALARRPFLHLPNRPNRLDREHRPMTDSRTKALTAHLELPRFKTTSFTTPPPLRESTFAIVTTAALHHPEQDNFAPTDTGFRVLDGRRRDLQLGHWSPNFDTTGFTLDINVVFPIDRLEGLRDAGRIGGVAERNVSFAGNQFDLTAIRIDSGPAAARMLRDDGIDVVLLTPV